MSATTQELEYTEGFIATAGEGFASNEAATASKSSFKEMLPVLIALAISLSLAAFVIVTVIHSKIVDAEMAQHTTDLMKNYHFKGGN